MGERTEPPCRLGEKRETALFPSALPHPLLRRPLSVLIHQHKRQQILVRLSHLPHKSPLQRRSAVAVHPPDRHRRGRRGAWYESESVCFPPPHTPLLHEHRPLSADDLQIHASHLAQRTGHRLVRPPLLHRPNHRHRDGERRHRPAVLHQLGIHRAQHLCSEQPIRERHPGGPLRLGVDCGLRPNPRPSHTTARGWQFLPLRWF